MDDLVVAYTLADALERLDQRMNVTFGDKLGRSNNPGRVPRFAGTPAGSLRGG